MAVSILLYEDNNMLRESISSMIRLDEQFVVSGAFENVLFAESQISEIKPDIVLMDIDMPGRTGIEAVKQVRASGVKVPILMLTVFDDTKKIYEKLQVHSQTEAVSKALKERLV
ncbi:MAG: response regulator transcription factor [Flammeovirgaceae bacterium]|nr:response regulator transcription factor [Flammeovirgaceae bacterium]